jgi:hypothetical protein
VYVTGLPDDTDADEVAGVFVKCGIIKLDDAGQPRIKLYRCAGHTAQHATARSGRHSNTSSNGLTQHGAAVVILAAAVVSDSAIHTA